MLITGLSGVSSAGEYTRRVAETLENMRIARIGKILGRRPGGFRNARPPPRPNAIALFNYSWTQENSAVR